MDANQTDITIIGAGAAGLTLAVLLAEAGLHVTLADPQAPPTFKNAVHNGRTVALMNTSINILRAANIWNHIAPLSCPMQKMRIIDDSLSNRNSINIEFPAHDIGLEQFSYNVPLSHLRGALFDRFNTFKNTTFINDSFATYTAHANAAHIEFKNTAPITSRLIIGADGRNSAVREAAGITATTKKYNQSAITCLINHTKSHENTSTEFHRENGPMALVPLLSDKKHNQSSVVWVERTEAANEIAALPMTTFTALLQEKTNDLLGDISVIDTPQSWPLCTSQAKALIAPRIALIAEAAHVMSPITAQGLNLSLRDVAALAETILDAARLGSDIGAPQTLNTYARRRRVDIQTRIFGVDRMNTIVSTQIPMLKDLRRNGLKSLDRLPYLKPLAMHIGLAPKSDEGRLMRGQAL